MADGGKFGFEIAIDDKATPTLKATTAQMQSLEKTGVATGAKVGSSFGAMAKSFALAAGGALVLSKAFGVLKSLATTALKNAAEQVEANAQLEFQYGANAAALIKQASALQIVTKFGDDQIQNAQFALGTFKLTADAVEKLTPAILDFAQAKKVDATTAANLFGKAMSGNIGMLGRFGIALTDAQKQILQTGTEQQKVAVITQELGARFGGVAEEMNKTVPGAVASLKKAWGELLESQGMLAQDSEVLRVGIQSVANELFALSGESITSADAVGELAIGFANATIAVGEAIGPLMRWGGVLKNATEMAITVSTLNFGDVLELPASVVKNWKEMGEAFNSTMGADFTAAAMRTRDAMIANRGKTALRARGGGGAPIEGGGAGGKGGAGPSGFTDEAFADEVRKWEEMDAQIADTNFAWAVTRVEREEALIEEARTQQFANEVRAWEERDAMAAERSKALGELVGGIVSQGIQGVSGGIADSLVDGAANWQEIGKNFLKSTIATTAQLVIQLALWKAIQASATATAVASAAASGGTTTAGGFFAMGLGSALGAGGGLFRHQGGPVRYHAGGPIMRAHSGMRLGSHEVPIVAERGEFVMRRSAVNRIGSDTLDRMNRGERVGGGVNITINAAPGQSEGAIADAVMDRLIRESRRGRAVINARGLEQ